MDISEIRKQNLERLINELTLGSQKNFASIVGTSPAYLSQIINGTIGRNGKPATVGTALARKIERALGLQHGAMDQVQLPIPVEDTEAEQYYENNYTWINNPETGEPISVSTFEYKKRTQVPVISWVQAGSFTEISAFTDESEVIEWLPKPPGCDKDTYGLIINGLSMAPKFLPGDVIYVTANITPFQLKTDDLVIVSCAGDTEATFKKLIIEGKKKYLQPLNPDWPEQIIELSEDCRLVAKVTGLYRKI